MARTVLITGCSSGIGRASAQQFASEGWNVVATMRDLGHASDFTGARNIIPLALDVQDPAGIERTIEEAIEHFGAIDAVVNNAGFALLGTFEGAPDELVAEQFGVNVFGVMNVTRAILPHFRQRRSGTIVNISSAAGAVGMPLLALYCASKFALEGFSESLSYELAPLGINVKIVELGIVPDTRFNARSVDHLQRSEPIQDYDDYVSKAAAFLDRFGQQASSNSVDVAKAIVGCTGDSNPQLRYALTDDIVPLLAARRGSSEEVYMQTMRGLCSWE
ncbi:SDR family oxidoreductase [Sphingomonadaceae bacterium OTU29THOMA1]|nr:SDR family oxidoreductase [Sphingomonadaceae bacterium OTU29THOMA1]